MSNKQSLFTPSERVAARYCIYPQYYSGRTNSSLFPQSFCMSISVHPFRHQKLLHIPHARVNSIKGELFMRLPMLISAFPRQYPGADLSNDLSSYDQSVVLYVSSLQVEPQVVRWYNVVKLLYYVLIYTFLYSIWLCLLMDCPVGN